VRDDHPAATPTELDTQRPAQAAAGPGDDGHKVTGELCHRSVPYHGALSCCAAMIQLADPLSLPCGARLDNRIAKAAMSEQLGGPAGEPSEGLVRLYERWGRSGAGLLITGNVMLDGRRRGEAGNVVVEDDRHA